MAPEQMAGRHAEIGPATDVYALGVTLYEVLTGRPPLRGDNDAETVRLVLDADPVSLRSLRPGLPRDLETICFKCVRKSQRDGTLVPKSFALICSASSTAGRFTAARSRPGSGCGAGPAAGRPPLLWLGSPRS